MAVKNGLAQILMNRKCLREMFLSHEEQDEPEPVEMKVLVYLLKEGTMSKTNLGVSLKSLLTYRAGGRCEFEGCNKDLSVDGLTKLRFNNRHFAHIIADSPDGPRGREDSWRYAKDINNIMLMCPEHHKMIDSDVERFTVEYLDEMKKRHEDRVQQLLSIKPEKRVAVVIYNAIIGSQVARVSNDAAIEAIWPDYYPSYDHPIELGVSNSSVTERDETYWKNEVLNLEHQVQRKIIERILEPEMQTIALFAMAPMPLLVKLGTLLSDKYKVLVYQKHRVPDTWKWQDVQAPVEFELKRPENVNGEPCLVFSISANIRERVEQQFPSASIWEITVPEPRLDYLQAANQLSAFSQITRIVFGEIQEKSSAQHINVFMAMPNACAVEVGRAWMPKANLPLRLFDYYRPASELDRYAFTIENL